MSEFNGTPGPWRLGRYAHVVLPSHDLPQSEGGGIGICHVYGTEKRKYNADLIAAAPDLLHELTEADKTLCVLQANVADAQTREPRWEGVWQEIQARRDSISSVIAKALNTEPKGEGHE